MNENYSADWFDVLLSDERFCKAFNDYLNQKQKKNRIINLNVFKKYMYTYNVIKKYLETNFHDKYSITAEPNSKYRDIGTITIRFDTAHFKCGSDFRKLMKYASSVEFCVSDKNIPEIVVSFSEITKVI